MWWQYVLLFIALILLFLNCKRQHEYKCEYYDIKKENEPTYTCVFIGGLIAFLLNCTCAWYVIDFIINGF